MTKVVVVLSRARVAEWWCVRVGMAVVDGGVAVVMVVRPVFPHHHHHHQGRVGVVRDQLGCHYSFPATSFTKILLVCVSFTIRSNHVLDFYFIFYFLRPGL